MPSPGACDAGTVELALIAVQFAAVMAKLAAVFAHFMALTHHFAVNGMGPGVADSWADLRLSQSRSQREERGSEQELAHGILLQTGSLACDHG
ncbi:hypothetical protein NSE01_11570 [Novosphingobium sediminis]|uniref:Uncharacterized protein n=1 Tax=Novosphingobium sediminis TaxID=707214 RepID=A0A512AI05_9SPHN|nr:hypothetical protein NSE01_11570 [Novosphingobium sediminis]